jgi:hypothetical protein
VKGRVAAGAGEAASAPLQKTDHSPGSLSTNGASPRNGAISLSETLLVADES